MAAGASINNMRSSHKARSVAARAGTCAANQHSCKWLRQCAPETHHQRRMINQIPTKFQAWIQDMATNAATTTRTASLAPTANHGAVHWGPTASATPSATANRTTAPEPCGSPRCLLVRRLSLLAWPRRIQHRWAVAGAAVRSRATFCARRTKEVTAAHMAQSAAPAGAAFLLLQRLRRHPLRQALVLSRRLQRAARGVATALKVRSLRVPGACRRRRRLA